MKELLLKLKAWDAADEVARRSVAEKIVDALERQFELVGLTDCRLAAGYHQIARYCFRGRYFRLIPGADATLGRDCSGGFESEATLEAAWQTSQERIGKTFREYLRTVMTPLRIVRIAPLLIEEKAELIGRDPASPPEPVTDDEQPSLEGANWSIEREVTLAECRRLVEQDGFRLLTSDEWEFACAAGARTLWRWGDMCPLDCYPEEAPRGPEDFERSTSHFFRRHPRTEERIRKLRAMYRWNKFDLHVRPNAFGLAIAYNPGSWEACAQGELRGGDGGNATGAAIGFVASWLTLASSFCQQDIRAKGELGVHLRRAITVPIERL